VLLEITFPKLYIVLYTLCPEKSGALSKVQ